MIVCQVSRFAYAAAVIYCLPCIIMRPAGIYLVQAEIGAARITNLPDGDILLTLRIGRNYASANYSRNSATSPITFNTTLQLNVDSSALETQRCSLTMSLNTPNDKRMIGIALISLPKDKKQISSSYRLTQNEDKKAEVDIRIKIVSIDSSTLRNTTTFGLNSETSPKVEQPKPEAEHLREGADNSPSNINLKSKASEQRSGPASQIRNLSLRNLKSEGDKVIEVSEAEVRRFRNQKDVYYQMYQIEKSKNEVAYKFISTLIKKMAEKFPNLVPSQMFVAENAKKNGDSLSKPKQNDQTAALAQLEQANRCLHRQIDQYKKVIDQLKQQLFKNVEDNHSKRSGLVHPFGLDLAILPKLSQKDKSNLFFSTNVIPSSLKEPHPSASVEDKQTKDLQKQLRQTLAGLDLKKWLQQSIGQRQEIQSKFTPTSTVQQQQKNQSKINFLKKLRSGIDKAFSQLLTNKDVTKAALLTHKQEVNRLLDENLY